MFYAVETEEGGVRVSLQRPDTDRVIGRARTYRDALALAPAGTDQIRAQLKNQVCALLEKRLQVESGRPYQHSEGVQISADPGDLQALSYAYLYAVKKQKSARLAMADGSLMEFTSDEIDAISEGLYERNKPLSDSHAESVTNLESKSLAELETMITELENSK